MTDETAFNAALLLTDASERAEYLAACPDPEQRARVAALLEAHESAKSFLERPADPEAGAHTRTLRADAHDDTADESDLLALLAPPGRPDSRGRIGHYEVLQVLGRGGFGAVYRAFDEVLLRVVAVKVLLQHIAATSPARKRFLREARTLAQVRHENVVQVYEVGEAPLPYLVMEFVPGETLQARLDRVGPVEPAEVVRIGRQIAEGLAAAHATGLVHRDIKPGNVLLEGPHLRVKITDFGLARAADDASISQSGLIAGTPLYMAPEQAKGDHIDHRSDLFSLGSVLYQMLSGRPPFRAANTLAVLKRVCEDDPRPIRELIPEAPQWLCDIVAKLHAKNPDDRFQTAREVADVLAQCEEQLKRTNGPGTFPQVAKPPVPREPREPRNRRSQWKWAAAGLLLPTMLLAALVFSPLELFLSNRGEVELDNVEAGYEVTVRQNGTDLVTRSTRRTFRVAAGVPVELRFFATGRETEVFRTDAEVRRGGKARVNFAAELAALEDANRARASNNLAGIGKALHEFGGPRATAATSWGPVVDPLEDCSVTEADGRLTFRVPGDGFHDLNPTPGWNQDAPRVLREFDGDFEVTATVFPFPRPTAGSSARPDGTCYVGAGLVVMADDRCALRFLRAGLHTNRNGAPYAEAEWFVSGAARRQKAAYVADGPVHLRIQRVGAVLHLAHSADGREWSDLQTVTDLQLGARVRVGAAAVSSIKRQFEARVALRQVRPIPVKPPASRPGVPSKALEGNPACVPQEYSPDGKWLAAQDHDGTTATVRVWDSRTGEARLTRDARNARCMTFSPDGRLFAVCEGREDEVFVTVFDTTTFAERKRWKCDSGVVRMAFDPTGKVLAMRGRGGVVLYESETGKEAERIETEKGVDGISFSPSGKALAVEEVIRGESRNGRYAMDTRVTLFDIDPKSPTFKKPVHVWDAPDTGHSSRLRFTPDGTRLAFTRGTDDERIGLFVYDLNTGKQVAKFVPEGGVTHIVVGPFLSDGHTIPLATGSQFGTLLLWDAATETVTRTFPEKDRGGFTTLAVDPSGRTICIGGALNREPQFYDLATGKELVPGTKAEPPFGPSNPE